MDAELELGGPRGSAPKGSSSLDTSSIGVHFLYEIRVGFGHGPPFDLHGRCEGPSLYGQRFGQDPEDLDLFEARELGVDALDRTRKLPFEVGG